MNCEPGEFPCIGRTYERYPQIATEILTSELWTITETVMASRDALLTPFWDAVLPDRTADESHDRGERERARDEFWSDKDEERDRKREVIRGMWVRVNGTFMAKRTTEVRRSNKIPAKNR